MCVCFMGGSVCFVLRRVGENTWVEQLLTQWNSLPLYENQCNVKGLYNSKS